MFQHLHQHQQIHMLPQILSIQTKKRHTTEILTDHRGNSAEHTVHHVIKIHVKKGQQVGGYIPELSHYNTEKEFLINNGHTLHFTGKHEDYKQTPSSTDATPRIYRFHHANYYYGRLISIVRL